MMRSTCAALLVLVNSISSGEEPDLRAIALDSVKDYVVEDAGAEKVPAGKSAADTITRVEQPIIRFTTNGIDEGDIFLWTQQNRPAFVGQVFRLKNVEGGLWLHEFQSLRSEPFSLLRDGKAVWSPKSKGLQWRILETDLVPADAERIRLTQFKSLARDFTGTEQTPGISGGPELKNFTLALKPREAYRYECKSQQILDGIVFWYTQEDNTDPELLLIIEAVLKGEQKSWRYAVARLSCWPMQIDHKGTRVADLPNMLDKSEKSDPYFIWRPTIR